MTRIYRNQHIFSKKVIKKRVIMTRYLFKKREIMFIKNKHSTLPF